MHHATRLAYLHPNMNNRYMLSRIIRYRRSLDRGLIAMRFIAMRFIESTPVSMNTSRPAAVMNATHAYRRWLMHLCDRSNVVPRISLRLSARRRLSCNIVFMAFPRLATSQDALVGLCGRLLIFQSPFTRGSAARPNLWTSSRDAYVYTAV